MNIYDLNVPKNNIEYAHEIESNRVISCRFMQDLSNCEILCEITVPEKQNAVVKCDYDPTDHMVYFVVPLRVTLSVGTHNAQFCVVDEDGTRKTNNFKIVVSPSVASDKEQFDANELQMQKIKQDYAQLKESLLNEVKEKGNVNNLVINNSFRVSQRGDELTVESNQYGCDMWMVSAHCKIQLVSNGLKIVEGSNVTLRQIIEGNHAGETLCKAWSVNGTRHTQQMQGSSKTVVEISGLNAGDVLNYCDLWTRSIDYPHMEENYAITLQKCQRYFYCLENYSSACYFRYWTMPRDTIAIDIILPVEMASQPTVKVDTIKSTFIEGGSESLVLNSRCVNNSRATKSVINLAFTTSKSFDANANVSLTVKDVVVSCEPTL